MDIPREPLSAVFDIDTLGTVRGLVEDAAERAQLSDYSLQALLIAVNEITANAIRYGGGSGRITIELTTDGVEVEISDDGPGMPPHVSSELPPSHAVAGRGLWMARTLCPDMKIMSSDRGVTVRLFMARTPSAT